VRREKGEKGKESLDMIWDRLSFDLDTGITTKARLRALKIT